MIKLAFLTVAVGFGWYVICGIVRERLARRNEFATPPYFGIGHFGFGVAIVIALVLLALARHWRK